MFQFYHTNIFPKQIQAGYTEVNLGVSPDLVDGLDFKINNKNILNQSLDIISTQLGLDKTCIVTANQVHQDNVLLVNQKLEDYTLLKTDAIVTQNPEIIPSIRSADCGNILLFDPKTNIRAAIHSGYRGTGLNIVSKTIDFITKLGCVPSNIFAFIGPSIAQNALWVWNDNAKFCPDQYKVKIDKDYIDNQKLSNDLELFKYYELAQTEIKKFETPTKIVSDRKIILTNFKFIPYVR